MALARADDAATAGAELERQRRADYFAVFTTDAGKRVLADLEKRGFWRKGTLTMARSSRQVDPHLTVWAEGRRSMLIEIHEAMEKAREHRSAARQTKAITSTTTE